MDVLSARKSGHHVHAGPTEAREGLGSPWTWVADVGEPLCRTWESNPHFLEEKPMFLFPKFFYFEVFQM